MKRVIVYLILLSTAMFLSAHDTSERVFKTRLFESPGIELMETPLNGIMTGIFNNMHVCLKREADNIYRGWAMKENKKLPISIEWEKDKLKADFNGFTFQLDTMSVEKGIYTFSTSSGTSNVSILYETKEGKKMQNPLFVIEQKKKNYLVRLKGHSCIYHGLYYAAVLYGLSALDENEHKMQKI